MTIPLDWPTYLDTIARLAVVGVDDENFVALSAQMTNYAELRIQRDLDFLQSVSEASGPPMVSGSRTLPISLAFITVQEVHVLTPVGAVDPDTSNRRPLVPVTKEFITTVFGGPTPGLPRYFAMLDQETVVLGPRPDAAYSTVMVGTQRLPSLYALEPGALTFISTFLPDLLIMATMVWISGYQRNFGRQSDDPQQAVSYESQYKTLLMSALVEEARKKFQGSAWSSMTPAAVASPSRQVAGAPG